MSPFIKRIFSFSVAACFMFMSFAQQAPIGVQLHTFRDAIPKDIPGTMKKISDMGLKLLEGGGTYGLPLDSFKAILKKNDMRIVSTGADFKELESNIPAIIERAKSFGAKYAVCFWIPHNGDDFTFNDMKKAVEVFNKAGKQLKEAGISLCYHPHGYEFRPYEGNKTLFDYLLDNTDPKYVNYEMDVFWIKHPGQDPVAILKKYPGRFPLMHLKDRKPGTEGNQNGRADVESNVVLGTGDVGIAEIMKQAKKSGVKYFFIEDESSRSMEQVPLSLAFLRGL